MQVMYNVGFEKFEIIEHSFNLIYDFFPISLLYSTEKQGSTIQGSQYGVDVVLPCSYIFDC